MSDDERRAVVEALAGPARSHDYRDRADAGCGLAVFAGAAEARRPLVGLLLDAGDTFVTRATAEALLRRHDPAGLAVVATALAAAGPQHADWIGTAVLDVFAVSAADRDAAVRGCEALARDRGEQVRRGAGLLLAVLGGIEPALRPVPTAGTP